MTWFSYFLLSVPEAFLLLAVSFALFNISVKKNLKSMIIFAIIYGGVSFSLNIFMDTSIKPLISLTVFTLLVIVLFRLKVLYGFIIGIISFILLVLFELLLLLPLSQVIPLEQIVASPWLRILAGVLTIHLPLLIIILVIKKFKLSIKVPLVKK
ncbi:MAG: hypothetical protein ACK4M9_01010 [Anaerobacillus sp.]|uniref:hypothetical protein n=1 Tax=Anaerobacillus sp. TaxID=1872506 RepID=UPI00391B165C